VEWYRQDAEVMCSGRLYKRQQSEMTGACQPLSTKTNDSDIETKGQISVPLLFSTERNRPIQSLFRYVKMAWFFTVAASTTACKIDCRRTLARSVFETDNATADDSFPTAGMSLRYTEAADTQYSAHTARSTHSFSTCINTVVLDLIFFISKPPHCT